jgi:hypothetical protein
MVTISKFFTKTVITGSSPSNPGNVVTDIPPVVNPPSSGGALSHLPVTIASPENGLSVTPDQLLSIGLSSASTIGALSSANWSTFNSKIGGTGIAGQVAFWNGVNVIEGDAGLVYNSTTDLLTITGTSVSGISNLLSVYNNSFTANAQAEIRLGASAIRYAAISALNDGSNNIGLVFTTGNGATITEKWRILGIGGVLQSNGAQTIQTSTGNLTLETGGANGNILLRPNGTGMVGIDTTPTERLDVNGRIRARLIDNGTGNFITKSATGVLQERTALQVRGDIGAQATLTNPVTGTGTLNFLPKFTGVSSIGNSQISDNGTNVGIGVISAAKFAVKQTLDGQVNGITLLSSSLVAADYLTIWVDNADVASLQSGDSLAYRILALNPLGGNVGINTSSPTERLDIDGRIRIRTIANAVGNFITKSATGVLQERTAAQTLVDIGGIGGTGTINRVPKFTAVGTIGDSRLIDTGLFAYFSNQGTNTFFGNLAGEDHTTTTGNNVAYGHRAGLNNVTGFDWSAFGEGAGANALSSNWSAFGRIAGFSNTSGESWTAFGRATGFSNTTGSNWTAIGRNSAFSNIAGSYWITIGNDSGRYYSGGTTAATSFSNGVYIGNVTKVGEVGATNEIVIGYQAEGLGSNNTVIGNSSTVQSYLRGNLRIGTIANAVGNILTTSATGVVQQRTLAEVASDGGFVTITGAQTITGVKTFNANTNFGDIALDYVGWDNTSKAFGIFSQVQFLHKYRGGAAGALNIGQFDVSGNASINNTSNAGLLLGTNNTTRIEIEADGDVLLKKVDIGTGDTLMIEAGGRIVKGSGSSGSPNTITITSTATETINVENNKWSNILLQSNAVINITSIVTTNYFKAVLRLKQDATSGRTVTWNTGGQGIIWKNGTAPVLAGTANWEDLIELFFDGTRLNGVHYGNFG